MRLFTQWEKAPARPGWLAQVQAAFSCDLWSHMHAVHVVPISLLATSITAATAVGLMTERCFWHRPCHFWLHRCKVAPHLGCASAGDHVLDGLPQILRARAIDAPSRQNQALSVSARRP